MESEVRFAMPGIGFTGPGTLFGKAAQIGRFFFPQKTSGTDKIFLISLVPTKTAVGIG